MFAWSGTPIAERENREKGEPKSYSADCVSMPRVGARFGARCLRSLGSATLETFTDQTITSRKESKKARMQERTKDGKTEKKLDGKTKRQEGAKEEV